MGDRFLQIVKSVSVMKGMLYSVLVLIATTIGLSLYLQRIDMLVIGVDILLAIFASHLSQSLQRKDQHERDRIDQEQRFAGLIKAMTLECSNNLRLAKEIVATVGPKGATLARLDNAVAINSLQNDLPYSFFNQYHIMNLRLYVSAIESLNRRLDMIFEQFRDNRVVPDPNLELLNGQINRFIIITLMLQINLQKFINIFGVRFGPLDGDSTLDRLKKIDEQKITDLEKELVDIGEITGSDRTALEESYRSAYDETHQL